MPKGAIRTRRTQILNAIPAALLAISFGFAAAPAMSADRVVTKRPEVSPAMLAWLDPSQRSILSAKEKKSLVRQMVGNRHQGNGSYICSASGFGKRSACFRR